MYTALYIYKVAGPKFRVPVMKMTIYAKRVRKIGISGRLIIQSRLLTRLQINLFLEDSTTALHP